MTRLRRLARSVGDVLYPFAMGTIIAIGVLVLVERGLEVARVLRDNDTLRAEVSRLEARAQTLQGIVRRQEAAEILRTARRGKR